jgi:hypothetical protein
MTGNTAIRLFGKRDCMTRILLASAFFVFISAVGTFAQSPPNSSGDQDADVPTSSPLLYVEKIVANSREQFTGLLNGSGLISTDSDRGLIISAEAGGGWDSNPSNSPSSSSNSLSSSMYSVSPYIAFHGTSAKNRFFIQYQPTFSGYPSGTHEGQIIHAASLQADGRVSERLGWNVNINGSYGQDGARFVAPLQSVAVGEVPGTATSTASYLPGSGSIAYALVSLETDYRTSERGTVAFDFSNAYNSVAGYDQAGGTAAGKLRYRYNLSSTLTLMIYGQGSHFYGDLNCEGIGAGGGIDWRPGINATLTFEAGPQISTGACGDQQGYSYAVQYSTRLSNRTQFYLIASRQPMVSYLGPGAWQNGGSAGMQYQVTRLASAHVDVGYASSTALAAVSSYSGIYINASYDVHLKHNFRLSYGYRGYFADSAGTRYNRSLALVSLKWASNSGKIFQNQ